GGHADPGVDHAERFENVLADVGAVIDPPYPTDNFAQDVPGRRGVITRLVTWDPAGLEPGGAHLGDDLIPRRVLRARRGAEAGGDALFDRGDGAGKRMHQL